jgi:hypothetical protein
MLNVNKTGDKTGFQAENEKSEKFFKKFEKRACQNKLSLIY